MQVSILVSVFHVSAYNGLNFEIGFMFAFTILRFAVRLLNLGLYFVSEVLRVLL